MGRFEITHTHLRTATVPFSYMPRDTSLFLTPAQPKASAAVWVASNCALADTDAAGRQTRVQTLMAAWPGAVDSYGQCLRNKEWPRGLEPLAGSAKMRLLSRYKFTIAFESTVAEGYVTEKFYQPLIAGSVPVYWGAPVIASFAPGPRSYVDASAFESMDALAKHLRYLDGNEEAYAEYLGEP